MSTPRTPPPAALVVSVFAAQAETIEEALLLLTERFGPPAEVSGLIPFTETSYYAREFGAPLLRRFVAFATLVAQDSLADIKLACLGLEAQLTSGGKRRANIDPGLLSAERLVLATGKNYTHRIPLKGGIFADLTLIFTRGSYQTLPWTYPDYRAPAIIDLLNGFRAGYIERLRGRGLSGEEGNRCSEA
ncbi:MAG: DUF4416 family protein [Pseudomonadota bacterium]